MTTVAIHQPNFFPWLGYFDKLVRSDVFVILDHVQFPKSEGTWQNRVRLDVNGDARWVTMPIRRDFSGVRRIDEIRIDERQPWRNKVLQLLRTNYGRAGAFKDVFPAVEAWVTYSTDSVVEFNLHGIRGICERCGWPSDRIIRSSTLAVEGARSKLLVEIIKQVGGTDYLSGDGAGEYMDEAVFTAAGIGVRYQQFRHPAYQQRPGAAFVPGLSILDALFHCGVEGTAQLLQVSAGRGAAR